MNRRALLQGGLASLAGLLVARTVGAQVEAPPVEATEEPRRYRAIIAGTCDPGIDALYSFGEITYIAGGEAVERAMQRCKDGTCWLQQSKQARGRGGVCDWGRLRTNSFGYGTWLSKNNPAGYRKWRLENRDIFVEDLTSAEYQALQQFFVHKDHKVQQMPWLFLSEAGIRLPGRTLFRR